MWVRPRVQLWWDNFIQECHEEAQWRIHFRMTRDTFNFIVNSVRPLMERQTTNYRRAITTEKRVGVALWRLATGNEYRTLQELFGIGRSTACQILEEFVSAVAQELKRTLIKRPTHDEFIEIAQGYRDRWGFPQCVGAIDGCHIPIIAPSENRNDYHNRKGWYSIVLQAVCDHRYIFWDIEVGWPGRAHDARVYANSSLFQDLSENLLPGITERFTGVEVPLFIIGDPAYPLSEFLLKAYPGKELTEDKTHFNYRLSRARMTIENSFGRLKKRWRCLLKPIENDFRLVPTMVTACCILHNLVEIRGEGFDVGLNAVQPELEQPRAAPAQDAANRGRSYRDALRDHLFNG